MSFGITYGGGGGDFLPIVKYDSRAGRMYRVDRQDGQSDSVEITKVFKAVVDFENVEIGWIRFAAGGAPDFQMVPMGQPIGQKPSDEHRQGVRLTLKLSAECGGDVRELAGTAAALLSGLDNLHNDYLAGAAKNPGKLPVVTLVDTVPVESGSGAKRSTNYSPVFAIAGWAPRPKDLVASPRGGALAQTAPAPTNGHARPPAAGRTPVGPPPLAAGDPGAGAEDFGD